MALFNVVIFSGENYKEYQAELLRMLFGKLSSETHKLEHAENVLEMLRSCNESVGKFTQWVATIIIDIIDEKYMDGVVLLLRQHYAKDSQLSETLLEVLCSTIDLYLQITSINERQNQAATLPTASIEGAIVRIIKVMSTLSEILALESAVEVPFANGENVQSVGMLKYNALMLMSKVLRLPEKLVKAHFDLSKAKILLDLKGFITRNPWNNMVHGLVQQIVVSVVDKFESYNECEESYIGEQGFLAFLIETFKNKKYVFLNSG